MSTFCALKETQRAEEYVAWRFPHKKITRVANGLAGQGAIRTPARHIYRADLKATLVIRDTTLQVSEGHTGSAKSAAADCQTCLRRNETNLVWALLRRKIRIQGSPYAIACLWPLLSVAAGAGNGFVIRSPK